jgi:hypothetical protein
VEAEQVDGEWQRERTQQAVTAQTQLAHAAEAFWRSGERADQPEDLMSRVAEEHHFACRDHVERLTVMYAQASARYAVCAVGTASRRRAGRQRLPRVDTSSTRGSPTLAWPVSRASCSRGLELTIDRWACSWVARVWSLSAGCRTCSGRVGLSLASSQPKNNAADSRH